MTDKTEIQKRIQDMRGKLFQYRTYKVLFESVQIRGGIYTFEFKHANGNALTIEKDFSQLDLFLNCLIPINPETDENSADEISLKSDTVAENLPATKNYEPPLLRENRDLLISLRDMLMEDMKICRKDKSYIPQAKQACNTANSIINLAKLEIMMLRSE